MSMHLARAVADAVLWEGYLLYPYRASSSKNQIRWQFGVLGPPMTAVSGAAEQPAMHCECLLRGGDATTVLITLRFLQLVRRQLEEVRGGEYVPVDSLVAAGATVLSFDEATDSEATFGPFRLSDLRSGLSLGVAVPAATEVQVVAGPDGTVVGRTVRSRKALTGMFAVSADTIEGPTAFGSAETSRLCCTVTNTHPDVVADRDAAIAVSFLGAHLLLQTVGGSFLSLLEPAPGDEAAANGCRQSRCWPVLAGAPGDDHIMLASPIILYDYPALAPESAGALFDSTEIDEILTLRVLTLTDEEKAAARATDPTAAAIIDRCESMTPQTLAQLHGALRDPRAWDRPAQQSYPSATPAQPSHPSATPARPHPFQDSEIPTFGSPDAPWWDPGIDAAVSPTTDAVNIAGVRVAKGSLVRIHPSRRADAQDLFYAGQQARVTSVYTDVDDHTHVAVVLTDDPAADLHEWYGRFLYFAPEELEPLPEGQPAVNSDQLTSHHTRENQP